VGRIEKYMHRTNLIKKGKKTERINREQNGRNINIMFEDK
jgi:hypothetical protein